MNRQSHAGLTYRWIVLSICCLSFSCPTSIAQTVEGGWQGVLGGNLPLVFHLAAGGAGTVDSPSQNAFGMPMKYTLSASHINASIPSVGATYAGTVNGNQMTGTFTQRGQDFPLALSKASASQGSADSKNFQGTWTGTLGGNLPLVFHIAAGGVGTADSSSQNATNMPLKYTNTDTQHGQNIPLTLTKQ